PLDGEGLVALHARGFKTPFFCVHGIAGEVQVYAELARLLDPNRPFFGLRAPRWSPGDRFPSVEELAARHLIDVRRAAPKGPYLLGGYSSGATVAYEMAQQLVESGERVSLVVAMDSTLPNLKRDRSASVRAWLGSVTNLYWLIADDLMEADAREIVSRLRSKSTLLAGRLAKVPGFGWTRPKRTPDVRDALGVPWVPAEWAPLLEQHFVSHKKYQPRPYPGKVALIKARTRPAFRLSEPDLGWSEMAKGGVDVQIVRGSHSNMLREPHVQVLAEALRQSLDAADQAVVARRS
ncbi:MAG: alpha/beta fold hydrolase, partial [Vicinamibacterales bacterium]